MFSKRFPLPKFQCLCFAIAEKVVIAFIHFREQRTSSLLSIHAREKRTREGRHRRDPDGGGSERVWGRERGEGC